MGGAGCPTSHICPEVGQSAHECSTLRPSFPLEKTMRVKDLSYQLRAEFKGVTKKGFKAAARRELRVLSEGLVVISGWADFSGIRAGVGISKRVGPLTGASRWALRRI